MGKLLVMLFIILLAIVSLAGYQFLNENIHVGEKLITDGQRQLKEARSSIKDGIAELDSGKQELSKGKQEYDQAKFNIFLLLLDNLLQGGTGFKDAIKLIADGDKQIAIGEIKLRDGEIRADAGEVELLLGIEQLRLARKIRVAFLLVAVFFASLSVALGFLWRQSLPLIKSLSVLKYHKK